jgi:hypothetical protein
VRRPVSLQRSGSSSLTIRAASPVRSRLTFSDAVVTSSPRGARMARHELVSVAVELGDRKLEVWGVQRTGPGRVEKRLFRATWKPGEEVHVGEIVRELAEQDLPVEVRRSEDVPSPPDKRGRPQHGPYSSGWRDYRRRRRLVLLCWASPLLWFPLYALLAAAVGSGAHSLFPVFSVLSLGGFGCGGLWLTAWRCPRCERPYFRRGLSSNAFARRCMHCGLKRWAGE